MLKLTLKPGDYLRIGEEVKVVFSGGSANSLSHPSPAGLPGPVRR